MVLEPILCPTCSKDEVVKQRYKCCNRECCRSTFIRHYTYRGYLPQVQQEIADMAVNGSGIRDTARVLKISRTTVTETLKKRSLPQGGQ